MLQMIAAAEAKPRLRGSASISRNGKASFGVIASFGSWRAFMSAASVQAVQRITMPPSTCKTWPVM